MALKYVVIWLLAIAVVGAVGLVVAGALWLYWRVATDPSMTWVLTVAGVAVIIATIATCLEYLQDRNAKPEL